MEIISERYLYISELNLSLICRFDFVPQKNKLKKKREDWEQKKKTK